MEKPLNKLEESIGKRVHNVTQHASEKMNQEIETLIDKTIISPEIEAIVIQAVEQVILSLGQRYWRLLAVSIVGLLLIQSILLSFLLKGFLPVMN